MFRLGIVVLTLSVPWRVCLFTYGTFLCSLVGWQSRG